jgi:hypothetical protein
VPALTGRGEQKTPQVYVEYAQNEKTPPYPEFEPAHRGRVRKQMQAIRLGDFIGVRYNVTAQSEPFEIYNIVSDPKQAKNVAAAKADLQQHFHELAVSMRRPDKGAPRPYDDALIPAVTRSSSEKGIAWTASEQKSPWLARLDASAPSASGVAATINEVSVKNASMVLVSGFIQVPADGEYTFAVPPNATALLRIHEACVIDRAFAEAAGDAAGKVRLQAGRHPFRLYWQGNEPKLTLAAPGAGAQEIAPASLTH